MLWTTPLSSVDEIEVPVHVALADETITELAVDPLATCSLRPSTLVILRQPPITMLALLVCSADFCMPKVSPMSTGWTLQALGTMAAQKLPQSESLLAIWADVL